jgi:hypothetical protein
LFVCAILGWIRLLGESGINPGCRARRRSSWDNRRRSIAAGQRQAGLGPTAVIVHPSNWTLISLLAAPQAVEDEAVLIELLIHALQLVVSSLSTTPVKW